MTSPFTTWVQDQFTSMAFKYRCQLGYIVEEVKRHCVGTRLTRDQATAMIDLLQRVPVPVIGKYEGVVSDEDKDWYMKCLKPQWTTILQDAIKEINELSL